MCLFFGYLLVIEESTANTGNHFQNERESLRFVHKKIHPQVIKSAANLLFNTHIDMYTKNLAQVRRSKGKLQIPSKLYIYICDRK